MAMLANPDIGVTQSRTASASPPVTLYRYIPCRAFVLRRLSNAAHRTASPL
jgi:hypothetical protein